MRLNTTLAIFFACLMLGTEAFAANRIDIRFFPRGLDLESNSIYVDIELRTSDNAQIVLAGQNYRIFYDSEMMRLDMDRSVSQLPESQYSSLNLLERFENVDATNVGSLNFDNNMGFVNFSVELKDDVRGGIILKKNEGWKTVATLKFDLLEETGDYSVVWGREALSGEYATAYVEIAEWIEPLKTAHLDIEEYFDLNYEKGVLDGAQFDRGELVIGPNPATDFLGITLPAELNEAGELIIKDINGRIAKRILVEKGIRVLKVDLTNLISASYIVELSSEKTGRHFSEHIVKAE